MLNKILLFFCLLTVFLGFSQNDSVMPNSRSIYYVHFWDYMFPSPNLYVSYPTITIDKTATENELVVIEYQDTIAYLFLDSNKVYVKQGEAEHQDFNLTATYELLYDYDWQIGDSVYQNHGTTANVVEIDTLDFNGVKRKRFKLSNYEEIIQGIGSNKHPLQPKFSLMEGVYEVCAVQLGYDGPSDLDTLDYFFDCVTGLDEGSVALKEQIFPNPATKGLLNISTDHAENTVSIRVFDCFGREINVPFHSNPTNDEISADVSALTSGIYFITIDSKTGTRSYSVMIDNF